MTVTHRAVVWCEIRGGIEPGRGRPHWLVKVTPSQNGGLASAPCHMPAITGLAGAQPVEALRSVWLAALWH